MKCVILAGGKGERLWPLSREKYPKQFVEIQKNHSLFQETVSRNLPFCEEFIIVTNASYRFLVERQMRAFQGTPFRCVLEEDTHGILQALALVCMEENPSEYMFIMPCDHVIAKRPNIGTEELSYKDCVMRAKQYAAQDRLTLFTLREEKMDSRYGYVLDINALGDVGQYLEKPGADRISAIDMSRTCVYRNLGLLLCRAGVFLHAVRTQMPDVFAAVEKAFSCRQGAGDEAVFPIEGSGRNYALWETGWYDGMSRSDTFYSRKAEQYLLPAKEAELAGGLLPQLSGLKAVRGSFLWSQIDTLEDISNTEMSAEGTVVLRDSFRTSVINRSPGQAVIVNGADNLIVTNTPDVLYISRAGRSSEIRQILQDQPELSAQQGRTFYRPWGSYVELQEGEGYRVRRVSVPAGSRIPLHTHAARSENLTIVSGRARILLQKDPKKKDPQKTDPKKKDSQKKDPQKTDTVGSMAAQNADMVSGEFEYAPGASVDIRAGTAHQIEAVSGETLVFIETAVGDVAHGKDAVGAPGRSLLPPAVLYETEPLMKLRPAFKDYLWGGTRLRDQYGMDCDYDVLAEAWMLSAHQDGPSVLASGKYHGMYFPDYLAGTGRGILGWKCSPLQNFPLLVKLIDARDNLSVQVHPDDDYALANENQYGKNEMWYVMDSQPGAGLYVGFSRDVSAQEVEQRIADDTILEVLNFFPTKPGDVFFIPAGTVHAIGAGNLICEIQQSSNCTYRLYDYNRRDKFGNTRELHLKKALDVMNRRKYVPEIPETRRDGRGTTICRCKYFESIVYEIETEMEIPSSDADFASIVCMQGSGRLDFKGQTMNISAGESVFVPAIEGVIRAAGKMTLISSHV